MLLSCFLTAWHLAAANKRQTERHCVGGHRLKVSRNKWLTSRRADRIWPQITAARLEAVNVPARRCGLRGDSCTLDCLFAQALLTLAPLPGDAIMGWLFPALSPRISNARICDMTHDLSFGLMRCSSSNSTKHTPRDEATQLPTQQPSTP